MLYRLVLAGLIVASLSGCGALVTGEFEQRRTDRSSSLVDYLYPNGRVPERSVEVPPTLSLPLDVGIAFVPVNDADAPGNAEQLALLETVAQAFRDVDYVASIQTIPSLYLRSADGVVGFQQIAAMYSIDVMALVSYDQVSFSAERESAMLYLTVVGAAIVKGNTNEVRTMIDTAVFDVPTATLLFRAPGVHRDQRNATLIESDRDARRLRSEGLTAANEQMIGNLELELAEFEKRAKSGDTVRVIAASGGAGSAGLVLLLAVAVACLARVVGDGQRP